LAKLVAGGRKEEFFLSRIIFFGFFPTEKMKIRAQFSKNKFRRCPGESLNFLLFYFYGCAARKLQVYKSVLNDGAALYLLNGSSPVFPSTFPTTFVRQWRHLTFLSAKTF